MFHKICGVSSILMKFSVVVFIVLSFFLILNTTYTKKIYDIEYKNSTSENQNITFHHKTKTILLWNTCFSSIDCYFGLGKKTFYDHNCPVQDCEIIIDREELPINQYDAIVFHGPEYNPKFKDDYPSLRSGNQRYVYLTQESPRNYHIQGNLDRYFNWTMTYRLDSDIQAYYFNVLNNSNHFIAPTKNPQWVIPDLKSEKIENFFSIYESKSKPIAWFVSNCRTSNQREIFVKTLQKYIQVDIYGSCGPYKCPRGRENECFEMLKNDYYFYLSFENSNCKDYVTEKVINAINNDAIPIVFGGSNYTKFLPPHSYIDASKISPEQLALLIIKIQNDKILYSEYFWWKKYYKFINTVPNFCQLCQLLHNDTIVEKQYDILHWWHGYYDDPVCH